MLEQRGYLPFNAGSGVGVLFHTVSLRDLLRFHFCVPLRSLLCRLAQWMQTLSVVERVLWQWRGWTSSTSPARRCLPLRTPVNYDDHNMWNPMLGLLCHVQAGVLMDPYLDEACHFALDQLCDNADVPRAKARDRANAPTCEPQQILLHGREASGSA